MGLRFSSLRTDERGVASVEYTIVLILIAMLGLVTWERWHRTHDEKAQEQVATVSSLDW